MTTPNDEDKEVMGITLRCTDPSVLARTPGHVGTERLFPSDSDESIRTIFVVTVRMSSIQAALAYLRA